jgi:hypothetical protein
MRQVSILNLYLKHSGILAASITIALIAFLFLARRQMEPSFQVDIQHKLVEAFKTRAEAISDMIVAGNTTALDEFLKNPEFLKNADDFFKWIRKNFKNAKLPGYEGLLVSENAAKWVKETGGELVLN